MSTEVFYGRRMPLDVGADPGKQVVWHLTTALDAAVYASMAARKDGGDGTELYEGIQQLIVEANRLRKLAQ